MISHLQHERDKMPVTHLLSGGQASLVRPVNRLCARVIWNRVSRRRRHHRLSISRPGRVGAVVRN